MGKREASEERQRGWKREGRRKSGLGEERDVDSRTESSDILTTERRGNAGNTK